MRRTLAIGFSAAAVLAAPAGAVGPWPDTVGSITALDGTRYSVTSDGSTTELTARRDGKSTKVVLQGAWRVPAVTSTQLPGGLSPDGKVLVLVQQTTSQQLREVSKLLVVATKTLRVQKTVVLRGEFGFDALSPDKRTMYVIEHRNSANLNEYIVRAYDLARGVLLAQPVVAKGEGVAMGGYPISRVATTRGTWVYTLYWKTDGTTFVHALATSQRRAVCLDLTWKTSNVWQSHLGLSRDGHTLLVRDPAGKLVASVATPA